MGYIRELTCSDVQEITTILTQHVSEEYTRNAVDDIQNNINSDEYILLGAERSDGLIGVLTGIVYPKNSEHNYDIEHPEVISYQGKNVLLIKYGYVSENLRGQGIGSNLLEELICRGVQRHNIDYVVGVSWIRPIGRSSDELLEKFNFTVEFKSSEYFTKYNNEHTGVCNGCNNRLDECECSGAIYVQKNPLEVVDCS